MQKLKEENLSIRKMAAILHCDSKTIKQQLVKVLGVSTIKLDQRLIQQASRRKQWLIVVSQNREKSISQLKTISPNLYSWLYRNDKAWLYSIQYKPAKQESRKPRLSWEERDQQYLILLTLAYEKIMAAQKVRRASKTLLIRLSNTRSNLEKYLEKLPLSTCFISSVVESKEAYRVRKLHAYKNMLTQRGKEVKKWKLIRGIGIRKEHQSQKIGQEIFDILTNYSFS